MSLPDPHDSYLPARCPVAALGHFSGYFFFRDACGFNRMLRDEGFEQSGLLSLFNGDEKLLAKLWPLFDDDGNVIGWDSEAVAADLIAACGEVGIIWRSGALRLGFDVVDDSTRDFLERMRLSLDG